MPKAALKTTPTAPQKLNEDWLAVLIAFVLILLSVIGLFGPHGINIVF